jgi:hypothetical protein
MLIAQLVVYAVIFILTSAANEDKTCDELVSGNSPQSSCYSQGTLIPAINITAECTTNSTAFIKWTSIISMKNIILTLEYICYNISTNNEQIVTRGFIDDVSSGETLNGYTIFHDVAVDTICTFSGCATYNNGNCWYHNTISTNCSNSFDQFNIASSMPDSPSPTITSLSCGNVGMASNIDCPPAVTPVSAITTTTQKLEITSQSSHSFYETPSVTNISTTNSLDKGDGDLVLILSIAVAFCICFILVFMAIAILCCVIKKLVLLSHKKNREHQMVRICVTYTIQLLTCLTFYSVMLKYATTSMIIAWTILFLLLLLKKNAYNTTILLF